MSPSLRPLGDGAYQVMGVRVSALTGRYITPTQGAPMTTTDPTPLAEQIAREHWLDAHDECGTCRVGDYAAHIATVTEQAVRERVAAQIEAKAVDLAADEMFSTSATSREAYLDGMDRAACIARGATDA